MSLFANCRSQFLLDHLGRYLKHINCRSFLSRVRISVRPSSRFFFINEKQPYTFVESSCRASVQLKSMLNEPATLVTVDRQRPIGAATTAVIAATRLRQNSEKQHYKTPTTIVYTFTTARKNWFRKYHVAHAFVVRTDTVCGC